MYDTLSSDDQGQRPKHIHPCQCEIHRDKPYKPLSLLLLQCWQRQHDRRPYNTLLLNRIAFEKTYHRTPDERDYRILSEFLTSPQQHTIDQFELNYMPLPALSHCDRMLRSLAQMTHVSLCHVDMRSHHLSTLLHGQPCTLLSLRLSGNRFNMQHAQVLRTFLLENQTLAYLDIGYCSICPVLLATVADGMLHCTSLRAIDLCRVVQSHDVTQADAEKIALIFAQLMWSNRLREVHFKHNGFDGHDIVPMAECLERCRNLVYMDLGANRLGAHGMKVLFDALRLAPHLIGLDVSNNEVGEYGGLEIAHGLPFTKIRYLDIGRNSIPADAMRLILCTLKKSHPVRIFNIIGNHFDYTVGSVLRRQLDARILLLDAVDVKTTYDADAKGFRIVPDPNDRAQYNQRYFRVQPFLRRFDAEPNLLWHDFNRRQLLVNGLFLDAIFVNDTGAVYSLDEWGKQTELTDTKVYNF